MLLSLAEPQVHRQGMMTGHSCLGSLLGSQASQLQRLASQQTPKLQWAQSLELIYSIAIATQVELIGDISFIT